MQIINQDLDIQIKYKQYKKYLNRVTWNLELEVLHLPGMLIIHVYKILALTVADLLSLVCLILPWLAQPAQSNYLNKFRRRSVLHQNNNISFSKEKRFMIYQDKQN